MDLISTTDIDWLKLRVSNLTKENDNLRDLINNSIRKKGIVGKGQNIPEFSVDSLVELKWELAGAIQFGIYGIDGHTTDLISGLRRLRNSKLLTETNIEHRRLQKEIKVSLDALNNINQSVEEL